MNARTGRAARMEPQRVDQPPHRGRELARTGIIEVIARKRRTPIRQHADQPPAFEVIRVAYSPHGNGFLTGALLTGAAKARPGRMAG
ncbi:hypothetical protein QLH51_02700 [Sphingomonas sp. 2R-10]|uniref:hypothetical protein n=1 Tax=Sphingomonas sp. 2R-10 TaxID=3045148 RepID=UPI000F7A54A0|nr:hypothetical protein [Sphingomonas sp. 2R-10]MDJ0275718.1 hypothetical protein [Sphingomonas sp. 2R-10]